MEHVGIYNLEYRAHDKNVLFLDFGLTISIIHMEDAEWLGCAALRHLEVCG